MVTFYGNLYLHKPKETILYLQKLALSTGLLIFFYCLKDKAQPETQATSFGNVLFNAKLAADDPEAILLVNQPGSDGFKVDSTPLFQVGQ